MPAGPDARELAILAEEAAAELCDLVERHAQPGSLKAMLLELVVKDLCSRLGAFRSQYEPQPTISVEIAAAEVPAAAEWNIT